MTILSEPNSPNAFKALDPTLCGGPDYGRFVESVRNLQDRARAANAPDHIVTRATDLVDAVCRLLTPFDSDEWTSPSGRRPDLPNRGNLLFVPAELEKTGDNQMAGTVRFGRYHLGNNGAAHGGAISLLFDAALGYSVFKLLESPYQRTASLRVDYRKIVPIEVELRFEATIDRIEDRKIHVTGRITDGGTVLAEAEALCVKLRAHQP